MLDYDLNARCALYRCIEETPAVDILSEYAIAEGSLRKMLILAVTGLGADDLSYAIAIKGHPLLRSGAISKLASAEGIVSVI